MIYAKFILIIVIVIVEVKIFALFLILFNCILNSSIKEIVSKTTYPNKWHEWFKPLKSSHLSGWFLSMLRNLPLWVRQKQTEFATSHRLDGKFLTYLRVNNNIYIQQNKFNLFMVDKALLSYIRRYMQQGYDINSIRSHLLKYYPGNKVDEAIHAVYSPEVRHVIHFSPTVLIAIIAVVLGIGMIGFFLLRPALFPVPDKLLDLKASLLTTSVKAGQNLEFNIEMVNMGTIKGFDVSLVYNIYDQKNKLLISKEETIALVTKASTKATVAIPRRAADGTYRLEVTAKYGGRTASAKESFSIYTEQKPAETCFDGINNRDEEDIDCGGSYCNPCETAASCEDGIRNQGETAIDCGGPCEPCKIEPTCADGIRNQGEEGIDCGGPCGKCPETGIGISLPEKIEEIKEIAKTDKDRALRMCMEFALENYKEECIYTVAVAAADYTVCNNIAENRTKDKCFTKAAEITNSSIICDNIEKESRRDSCYMHFVMIGDYSVCDKIANQYLKQSCESLRSIQSS